MVYGIGYYSWCYDYTAKLFSFVVTAVKWQVWSTVFTLVYSLLQVYQYLINHGLFAIVLNDILELG